MKTSKIRALALAFVLVGPGVVTVACGESVLHVIDSEGDTEGSADRDGGVDGTSRAEAAADVDRGDAPGLSCADASPVNAACASSTQCCSGFCGSGATLEATCRPATGCLGVGSACSRAGACCSNGCFRSQGTSSSCAGERLCSVVGTVCTASHDCCSNNCANGLCLAAADRGCRPGGETCAIDGECCGRVCQEHGDGTPTCSLLQGCRPEGETCSTLADCCSQRCDPDATGVLRCSALTQCTSGDRKTCTRQIGDVCKDAAQCCSRVCLTTVDGTKRCAASGGCRTECEICATSAECCSGTCAAGADGVKLCQRAAGCGSAGELCDKDGDCCNSDGASRCSPDPSPGGPKRCHRPGTPPCSADTAGCALTSECCAGRCVPSSGGSPVCRQACLPFGAPCAARADCCGVDVDCMHLGEVLVCAPIAR